MKKIYLSLFLFAAVACNFMPLGSTACSQTNLPAFQLGYVNWNLRPGWNAVGIPVVRPAILHGTISGLDVGGAKLQITSFATLPAQPSSSPCYIEILSCPKDPSLAGERYEVVESNLTDTQIVIEKSALNTRLDLPAALIGSSYAVRPHWTVQTALKDSKGVVALQSGKTAGSADRISMPHCSLYPEGQTWYYGSAFRGRSEGLQPTLAHRAPFLPYPDPVIPPGQGLLVYRQGKPLRHVIAGEVRQTLFRRPLLAGNNLVSLGHVSHGSFAKFCMNAENGFTISSATSKGDKLKILHRDIWDSFVLRHNPAGLVEWNAEKVFYPIDLQKTDFIAPGTAFLIEKQSSDLDFSIPPLP